MNAHNLGGRGFSLWSCVSLPFRFAPVYALCAVLAICASSLAPTLLIFADALFINRALSLSERSWIEANIIESLCLIALIMGCSRLFSCVFVFAYGRTKTRVTVKLSQEIVHKQSVLRYIYIEKRESLDLISRISNQAADRVSEGFSSLLNLGSIVLRALGLVFVLALNAWWAALVLCLFFIPFCWIARKSGQANYEVEMRVSKLKREEANLQNILCTREYNDERFLFRYTPYITDLWKKTYDTAAREKLITLKLWQMRTKGLAFASILLLPSLSASCCRLLPRAQ